MVRVTVGLVDFTVVGTRLLFHRDAHVFRQDNVVSRIKDDSHHPLLYRTHSSSGKPHHTNRPIHVETICYAELFTDYRSEISCEPARHDCFLVSVRTRQNQLTTIKNTTEDSKLPVRMNSFSSRVVVGLTRIFINSVRTKTTLRQLVFHRLEPHAATTIF